MFEVLSDRKILNRLRAELISAMPDPNRLPEASKLDNLPLLNALIQEALRLYPGATHRQDRVAPDEELIYTDPTTGQIYTIPAGTAVGMTAPLVNRSAQLYERADEFLPDRYIDDPRLSKHLFTFSKGTRQCIGMNLAYQELQTFTAGIFRKYDLFDENVEEQGPSLQLFESRREDVMVFFFALHSLR